MAQRARRETPNLEVACLNPIRSKVLLIRGLFFYFTLKSCFLTFSLAFAKHSFISVSIIWSERNVDVPKHVKIIYPKFNKSELVNKFYLLFRRNAKNSLDAVLKQFL